MPRRKKVKSRSKSSFALAFGTKKQTREGKKLSKKRFKTRPAALKAAEKSRKKINFIAKITKK